jgi:hypothetical protein
MATRKRRIENEYLKPADGKEYGIADIEVCGPVSPNMFYGKVKMPDNTTINAGIGTTLDSGELAKGECSRGNLVFEVPAGQRPASFLYKDFEHNGTWTIG